jgi:hypothetical protein
VVRLRTITCTVLAALGVALCVWRGSRRVRPLVAFVFTLFFLQVATSGIYMRYFFPIFPPAIVLLLCLGSRIFQRSVAARNVALVAICLLLWGLHRLPQKVQAELATLRADFPTAVGSVSRETYLRQQLPLYPMIQWSNANLPPDATIVLGVIDSYASLFHARTLATNYWTQNALRYEPYDLLLSDLNRLGATHILIQENAPTPEMLAKRDKEARVRDELEFGRLARICAEHGTLLYKENGYALYILRK